MTDEDLKLYRGMIAERDKRIENLEEAIMLATYKDGSAVRVAWNETKDLAVGHPIFMAVHNR